MKKNLSGNHGTVKMGEVEFECMNWEANIETSVWGWLCDFVKGWLLVRRWRKGAETGMVIELIPKNEGEGE